MTMTLKGCPRCRGDVTSRGDQWGDWLECIQCGWVRDAGPPAPPLRRTLKEADRPESMDGCEVSPSCLSCPLERCKYDLGPTWKTVRRAAEARSLLAGGKSVGAVAERLGISNRTVYRIAEKEGA